MTELEIEANMKLKAEWETIQVREIPIGLYLVLSFNVLKVIFNSVKLISSMLST